VVAFALSGLTALILEVIWTRVLILIFGSTVYSFAAMLSVFLLGIALGGALFGKIADRVKSPYRLLGVMQAVIALIVLAEAATINYLPELFLRMLLATGVHDSSMMLIKFVISFCVLFPVTLVSGGTFPVVSKVYSDSLRHTGRDIGLIYSMNTVGAIVGSLLAGFAIVPLIGMRHGLMVAAWVTLGAGALTLIVRETEARPKPILAASFLAVGLAGTLLLPAWNTALLAIPVWFQPREYIGKDGKIDLNDVVRETKNLFYAEGVNDTIIVTANPTERILSINGKIIATSSWKDMLHLKMLGHLPALIHPGKRRTAINIGLGVGGTVSGLAAHDVEKVYGVELEPKVVQANPFFAEANDSILKNPKFQIVIADGRNYLSMSDRKYDIISSDPFEPFMTGAGDLYSKEFFELGRSRLNPDGIMTQWVPLHQTADPEFRSLLKSFIAVFPHCTVWFSGESVILIGSEKRLALDPAVLRQRMAEPGAVATLKKLGLDTPEQLLSLLVADEKSLAPYLEGAPLNTDGFPFVEYSSARSILKLTTGINLRRMSAYYLSPDDVLGYLATPTNETGAIDIPQARTLLTARRLGIDGMLEGYEGHTRVAFDKLTDATSASGDPFFTMWLVKMHERAGRASQNAGDTPSATAHFEEAVRLAPDGFLGLAGLGYLRLLAGDPVAAGPLLERAHALAPTSATIAMQLGAVYDALGDHARSRELYELAATNRPDLGMPLSLLAVNALNAGDAAEAERLFRQSLERTPDDLPTQEALIQTLLTRNRFDDAEQACLALVKRHPERAPARNFLGIIQVHRGDLPGAKASFLSAIEADPKEAESHYQLARVEMAQGEKNQAIESLKRAIVLGGTALASRASADDTLAPIVTEAAR
jgi:spermidine synthase